jgi:biopolymer transport protein ExbD
MSKEQKSEKSKVRIPARLRRKSGHRDFSRKKQLSQMSEINVTPLLDLAFALLIIFMIAAPVMEQSIRVDLPKQESPPTPVDTEIEFRTISIDETGSYFWDKEPVDLDTLKERIRTIAQEPEPPAVNIRGDRGIRYEKVVEVLDYIKEQKLTKISLGTRL